MTGLFIILILVLFLPFTVKKVEHNLEVFLFIMGILAAWVGGVFNSDLLLKSLEDPINITLAVLIAGLLFKWFQSPLEKGIQLASDKTPFPLFVALIVVVLGLLSSVITAIIAALVLVLIVSVLKLDRQSEIRLVVLACFSIGLGAALTPIGEPLSTITTSKLNEHFFYLMDLIGPYVIVGIIGLGILTALWIKPVQAKNSLAGDKQTETYGEILIRSVKIYLFVMGLTLLGAGFEPLINRFLIGLNPFILYWVNMLSAILDNATLASAEISPEMTAGTIKAILLGLLISGGMLIPGNIPNIISAGKLNITSKEWARYGLPIGLVVMAIYFVVLLIF
ncbi:DUF1646 family protein [Virgibacillus soli]|uniref:DUF1646 family protein n=1 Tax=Paracerasibacillus soli TaxID=480284 RepID=A0ABU5CY61_9BACI|nr:DUF1646 family protein [Virgibacillus soli]MDY0410363.1 DUF1646 family protein [Virgibacillus soli]